MAKDPAFLFYPNDYIGGTMGMTFEEKGAYVELLMLQFNRGHMTTHMIGQTVGQIWDNIKDKFIQDENGLWYNERLDIEKKKRKTFTESRKNNIKGVNQYTKNTGHMGGHTTAHMENENENENIIKDESKKFNFKKLIIDLGVDEQICDDWLKVRKTKRATNSQTAFNNIVSQIEKSGKTANECIKKAAENSWSGFKAEWIINKNQVNSNMDAGEDWVSDY